MSHAFDPELLAWLKDAGKPVFVFVAGFMTSRLTMSRKERADVDQKNFENTASLLERNDAAYGGYVDALAAFNAAPTASLDGFTEVATKGDRYLVQLNLLAAAVNAAHVERGARDTILMPKIRAAVLRTLPQHYDALREIARRQGYPYRGELRRSDYAALYEAVERFGAHDPWEERSSR